jgi:hypothetical protein
LEHEFYYYPYIGNVIIPTDEIHHFSEGLGSTTNQLSLDALITILKRKRQFSNQLQGVIVIFLSVKNQPELFF